MLIVGLFWHVQHQFTTGIFLFINPQAHSLFKLPIILSVLGIFGPAVWAWQIRRDSRWARIGVLATPLWGTLGILFGLNVITAAVILALVVTVGRALLRPKTQSTYR